MTIGTPTHITLIDYLKEKAESGIVANVNVSLLHRDILKYLVRRLAELAKLRRRPLRCREYVDSVGKRKHKVRS